MSYLELYKKRMNTSTDSVLDSRVNTITNAFDRNFAKSYGYKKGEKIEVIGQDTVPIDFIVHSGNSVLEQDITFRPNTTVKVGSYVTYDDRAYIVREVNYNDVAPNAHCFYCNQSINLKNIPHKILCYTNSTTYGSKGILDQQKFYELDSKTKIYMQRNEYTETIRIGQRVMFDNQYVYKITEKDDLVYKGMYIMVAQKDEILPMDDFENNIAWNEHETDDTVVEEKTYVIEGSEKVRLGETEYYSLKGVAGDWTIDDTSIAKIVDINQQTNTVQVKFIKRGWFTLSCDNKSLDIMVC